MYLQNKISHLLISKDERCARGTTFVGQKRSAPLESLNAAQRPGCCPRGLGSDLHRNRMPTTLAADGAVSLMRGADYSSSSTPFLIAEYFNPTFRGCQPPKKNYLRSLTKKDPGAENARIIMKGSTVITCRRNPQACRRWGIRPSCRSARTGPRRQGRA